MKTINSKYGRVARQLDDTKTTIWEVEACEKNKMCMHALGHRLHGNIQKMTLVALAADAM